MRPLIDLIDARASASSIVDEDHTIGEDTANEVHLYERPDGVAAITISGFTEVASGPASGEFAWRDGTNILDFNAADADTAIQVSYDGLGSAASARDVNRIITKLQGVKTVADGATVTLDFGDEWTNRVTLAGDRAIEVGTFPPAGVTVALEVHQDGTGTRVPTFDAGDFDGGTDGFPTLTTTASKFDLLAFYSSGSTLHLIGARLGLTP